MTSTFCVNTFKKVLKFNLKKSHKKGIVLVSSTFSLILVIHQMLHYRCTFLPQNTLKHQRLLIKWYIKQNMHMSVILLLYYCCIYVFFLCLVCSKKIFFHLKRLICVFLIMPSLNRWKVSWGWYKQCPFSKEIVTEITLISI